MKKLFWVGFLGLFFFEILNVYFIMPMPGSQRMNSLDTAYFLYRYRWVFRIIFAGLLLIGLFRSHWKRKWLLILPLALLAAIIYMANFKMAADHMFHPPKQLSLLDPSQSKVDSARLVIGIFNNGEAKAYPIQYLGYHHQVQDTIGGKPVIVTYCTVCRTGRVFEPIIDGRPENFRLVGMDHFNAMFEDSRTKSWWRQETGEAVAGKLKGHQLPEFYSTQTSLAKWLQLYPASLVMQADPNYKQFYDTTFKYESGKSRNNLTGTDSLSWKDKSWVIGIKSGKDRKAYDWNRLKAERMIQDQLGTANVLIVLASDEKSFFAFNRPDNQSAFVLSGDTITFNNRHFNINGNGIDTSYSLKPLPAYQEFWHSWQAFNPGTLK